MTTAVTAAQRRISVDTSPVHKKRSVLCILGASGLFTLMFALAKQLGAAYPVGEILFCRSFFGLIPLVPLIYGAGWLSVFRTRHPAKHAIRSGLGMLSLYGNFAAISTLPLTEASSLYYTAPIATTMLAIPLLKEKLTAAKITAILVGFLGVLITLQPHTGGISAGVLFGLFSAVTQALVAIELRSMGKTERSLTIVLYFLLATTVAGAITMLFHAVVPNLRDGLLLLAIGIVGGFGQLLMTEAYRHAPATLVAPLGYSGLLWAVILDFALCGRVPTAVTIAGVCTIAAAGVFLVTRRNI